MFSQQEHWGAEAWFSTWHGAFCRTLGAGGHGSIREDALRSKALRLNKADLNKVPIQVVLPSFLFSFVVQNARI